jgi:hypothetical protein
MQMKEPFGCLCLPFGFGVNVRDTAYDPGRCDFNVFNTEVAVSRPPFFQHRCGTLFHKP